MILEFRFAVFTVFCCQTASTLNDKASFTL